MVKKFLVLLIGVKSHFCIVKTQNKYNLCAKEKIEIAKKS